MTEIVEQRMKMEDNENKEETAKGISWLIQSLTESEKKENLQWEARGRTFRTHPRTQNGHKQRSANLTKPQ